MRYYLVGVHGRLVIGAGERVGCIEVRLMCTV
jgi:hypothetical protein